MSHSLGKERTPGILGKKWSGVRDGKKCQILMGAHQLFIFVRINGSLTRQSRIRVRKGANLLKQAATK
jgi:hypothetical protein